MPKTDQRVDAYIARAAEFARPILRHVRALVHEAVPEAEETVKWGMPSFTTNGKILCGMAAFKAHAAVSFWHPEMKDVLGRDVNGKEGMGSFGRITSLADLPADRTMRAYLKKAAALNEESGPSRPRAARAPKPPAAVPDDLAKALKKDRAAAKTWEAFPPGCRREYVEWITEAKREETRAKRLATTLEWLAEGKRRNWKYEAC